MATGPIGPVSLCRSVEATIGFELRRLGQCELHRFDERDRRSELVRREQPVRRLERGYPIDQADDLDYVTPFLD